MAEAKPDHRSEHPTFPLFVFLVSLREEIGVRVPWPKDPKTPEFRAAYNAALVDAIAAEDDTGDDCRELEAMHAAQRRARRGGSDE